MATLFREANHIFGAREVSEARIDKIRHSFVISISNGTGLLSHVVASVGCLISS